MRGRLINARAFCSQVDGIETAPWQEETSVHFHIQWHLPSMHNGSPLLSSEETLKNPSCGHALGDDVPGIMATEACKLAEAAKDENDKEQYEKLKEQANTELADLKVEEK